MTKKIFSRMMLEILLTRGLVHWSLGLVFLLLGRSGQLTHTTGLGVALAIFWRHATYPRWKKFVISLIIFLLAFTIFSLFLQEGWFISRGAFFWLGLIDFILAGLIWRFFPTRSAISQKKGYDDDNNA